MKTYLLILCSAIAWLVTGCFETTAHYVLNPDGSGKATLEVRSASMMENMSAGSEKDPLNELAKSVINKATGVEAWTDVETKKLDDGRNYFKGTAYFRDVNSVRFKDVMLMDSITFSKNSQGNMVLEINSNKESKKKSETKPLTNQADIDKAIKDQKNGYQQIKPMLTAFLSTMRTDASFELPGKIEKTSNFKTDEKGRVSIAFDGQKFIDALDKLMADEKFLKAQAMAGADIKTGPPVGEDINEMIFGEKGPIRATTKGKLKPLFDYEKEVAAAKISFEELKKTIDLSGSQSKSGKTDVKVENYKGGSFKNVSIARITYSDMNDPDYMLFGQDQSYQVTFIGELPGAIMKIDKVVLSTAVADNGEDLMPDDWNRETNWADLSKNKSFAKWSFSLKFPSAAVKGMKEISGTVYGQVAGKTKMIDTGIKRFDTGTTGNELGAIIEEANVTEYQHDLRLKFNVQESLIRDVIVSGPDGARIQPFSSYSSGYSEEGCTWQLSFEKLPASGSIKVELNDDVQFYEIPFKVGNVDLFGKVK
ncbi:hypothetical protein HUU42_11860 [bacterium]|nr:hypothetical protein [bacterium]